MPSSSVLVLTVALLGGALGSNLTANVEVGSLNCHSISRSATTLWCNANCNHNPVYCPASLCKCSQGPAPPPPPPAKPLCLHQEDSHRCFEACSDGTKFTKKGFTLAGKCEAKYNGVESTVTEYQCPDDRMNIKDCELTLLAVTLVTKGITLTAGATELDVKWQDCGTNADAKITTLTPDTIVLGATTAFTGGGDLTKDVTGGTFKMTMTGVGGVTLLSCSGDATKSAVCPIGLGPINVGTASYGAFALPQKAGHVTLPKIVSVALPTGLPGFATKTITTLTVTDSGGAECFCAKITTTPKDDTATVVPIADSEDSWQQVAETSCLTDDEVCFKDSPFVCCSGTCSGSDPMRCAQSASAVEVAATSARI